MKLNGHSVTFYLISIFIFFNGALQGNMSGRNVRHLPALFQLFRGLHGVENYQNVPPYLFLPSLLVFPSINQQHNTIIQESSGQENYQEINKSLLVKKYAKLVSSTNNIDVTETVDLNRTVYVKNTNENMTHKDTKTDNVTETVTTELTTMTDENAIITMTTETIGIYPPAKNNSKFINTLSLTTDKIEEHGINTNTYSYSEDLDMKNNSVELKHVQTIEDRLLPPYEKPFFDTFKPNVRENNAYFSMDNNSKPQFSAQNKDTLAVKGFKPLAGLYYDGFLHKPLTKKNGFKPV